MGSGERSQEIANLNARFLLDTHVALRWIATPRRLSPEQARVLRESVRRREPVAVSAISLLEIAVASGGSPAGRGFSPAEILHVLESDPNFEITPFTIEIAAEVAALGPSLRDPSDRAIVCTARVHSLRLITSDQRIIDSGLVPVVV